MTQTEFKNLPVGTTVYNLAMFPEVRIALKDGEKVVQFAPFTPRAATAGMNGWSDEAVATATLIRPLILRVPLKTLKALREERGSEGVAFVVSITAHMVGEMKGPASWLIDGNKLKPETRALLLARGCKVVQE